MSGDTASSPGRGAAAQRAYGINIVIEKFWVPGNSDGFSAYKQWLHKLTAGPVTLLAPPAHYPSSVVTYTDPNGGKFQLLGVDDVTQTLRNMLDRADVQVFAMVVRTSGESYHVVPRQHLPIFHVEKYGR